MTLRALVLLSASLAASGNPPALAQSTPAKPDYTRESSVFDHLDRVYRYAADGTGAREVTGVIEVHDQAAVKALSVLSFSFASASETAQLDYVRVRRPDGTLVPTPAADVQEQPAAVTREAPFYSDIKELQVPVRSLREGDTLEYHISFQRTRAEAPGHFWGSENFLTVSDGIVALSETVEIRLPKGAYINAWSPKYKSVLSEDPATGDHPALTVYRWHSSQLQPVAGKTRNELLRMENDPTLGTDTDPRPSHIEWTNFHSWAEVGAWYRSLVGDRSAPDDEVRAKAAALTEGKSTPDQRARAIYGFVAPQIRYIGVAFGIGRYQPHQAADVLRNQYGDCKDKTTLLSAMLSAAGITADAALIGIGVAFTPEVPSPAAFNHAINLAHVDGRPVWLDSTAEVAPYSLLVYTIRDKPALVIPVTGEARIEKTTADTPFPAEQSFEATGSLDDKGTSHSRITMDLRGDDELAFRQAVRSTSPAQYDQLMQQVSQSMNFAGKVTHATFSRPDDTASAFHVAYDYEREKTGDWENLRILPQLPPITLGDTDEKDPPVRAIELGQPHTETAHAVMKLPNGWGVELPAAVHAKSTFATFDKTYTFENGVLTTDRRIVVLKASVPASEWRSYHRWYKDAGLEGEDFIQLIAAPPFLDIAKSPVPKSSAPKAPEPDTSGGPAPTALARDLVRAAIQSERKGDWTAATDSLHQAEALDPKQPLLWSNYAFIAQRTGRPEEAIQDYRKEIELWPHETSAARSLAVLLMQRNKQDDAIVTLETTLEDNPRDESDALYLASIFTRRAEFPQAEKVLRTCLKSVPDSVNLKLNLGIALLHQDKKEEGARTLDPIVSSSSDPLQLNNAAYELGDAGVDLPLAEKAARSAVDLLEAATHNGETGRNALARANLLVDAWDTLGWILFREDKAAEAEPWIAAAWRNGLHAEPGYHLACVQQKLDHLDAARAQIALASTGGTGTNAASVQQLIEAKRKELHADNGTVPDPLPLRVYKLPAAQHPAAEHPAAQRSANIELSLTTSGIAVRLLDGDESLKTLFPAVQKLDLGPSVPPASHAILLRRAMLACDPGGACELILVSTSDAVNQ